MARDRDEDEAEAGADEEFDERDMPVESDVAEGDEPDVVPCPYCREEVAEDAERCPHCGSYLSSEDAPLRKPGWIIPAVIFCLALILIGWLMLRG